MGRRWFCIFKRLFRPYRQTHPYAERVGVFRRIVERERACADRYEHWFSLVVFEFVSGSKDSAAVHHVLDIAQERLRATDLVGWLDDVTLGILLPFTRGEDALKVANSLVEKIAAEVKPPEVEIFEYPSDESRRSQRDGPAGSRIDSSHAPTGLGVDTRAPNALSFLTVQPLPLWKRSMDFFGALTGIIFLAPLMVLVGLTVMVTSPGPILFAQARTGLNRRRFKMYKFRTMHVGAHETQPSFHHLNEMDGPLFKTEYDPRLTNVGRFLRKTSLDELPQFFNVLKGDMTLVGPRALTPLPSQYEQWQLRRFTVTPGIACWWQAERRAETNFVEWMRTDLRYIDDGISPLKDLRLMLSTFVSVITCFGGR